MIAQSPAPPAASGPPEAAPPPWPLTAWLSVLVAFTSLATLRSLLLPPWPRANPLPSPAAIEAELERHGLVVSAMVGEPALRNAEQALTPSLVWRLEDGQILRLRHGATRRYEAFQLAAITRNVPHLTLTNRTLEPPGEGIPAAMGTVKGGRSLQTCLVPRTRATQPFGVTLEQLTGLLMQRPNPPQSLLAGVVGLRPVRTYDCVVISLQAPGAAVPSSATWQTVVSSLAPILSEAQPESRNLR